jgi:hypothetical protein
LAFFHLSRFSFMLRFLLSGLLVVFGSALASAQTANTTAATSSTVTKTTKQPARATVRTRASSSRRVGKAGATKTRTAVVLPAKPDPKPVRKGPAGNGATGSRASADGAGQGAYAAPGEAIQPATPTGQSYNGPAPRRGKSENTLAPSSAK